MQPFTVDIYNYSDLGNSDALPIYKNWKTNQVPSLTNDRGGSTVTITLAPEKAGDRPVTIEGTVAKVSFIVGTKKAKIWIGIIG